MAIVNNVIQYFPCAKAPFDNGAHRLWTEANITDIFSFIFDVDSPIINESGTKLLVGGYMFTADAEHPFSVDTSYWIILDNGELDCDTSDPDHPMVKLYSGEKPTTDAIGGVAQRLKFTQPSIGNIDLQS